MGKRAATAICGHDSRVTVLYALCLAQSLAHWWCAAPAIFMENAKWHIGYGLPVTWFLGLPAMMTDCWDFIGVIEPWNRQRLWLQCWIKNKNKNKAKYQSHGGSGDWHANSHIQKAINASTLAVGGRGEDVSVTPSQWLSLTGSPIQRRETDLCWGLVSGQRAKWQFCQRLEQEPSTRTELLSSAGSWVGLEVTHSFMKLPKVHSFAIAHRIWKVGKETVSLVKLVLIGCRLKGQSVRTSGH